MLLFLILLLLFSCRDEQYRQAEKYLDAENYDAAQAAFAHRAKMNGLASLGQWSPEVDAEVDA